MEERQGRQPHTPSKPVKCMANMKQRHHYADELDTAATKKLLFIA